jgi:hypothetical protein
VVVIVPWGVRTVVERACAAGTRARDATTAASRGSESRTA